MISGVHLYVCVREEEVGLDICRGNEGLGGGTHTSHDMITLTKHVFLLTPLLRY